MGSELKVESREGEGSKFYFEVEFEHCNNTLTLASRVDSTIQYISLIIKTLYIRYIKSVKTFWHRPQFRYHLKD